ncbi:hypothetical protein GCM10011575_34450 [Microlunatus endophyticus]|uniref:Uncharacterized protein n=1 Tax=Microlunatus endophyticus TaxID=1716077 RepID=A0A917SDV6_9ACTN|nr:hypothetical protein GCM10011575_34450 [Microlunatus endophyticus]
MLGEIEPDPLPDLSINAVADRIDHPGTVLPGHDLIEGQPATDAGPGLPIGRIDTRADQPDAYLSRAGLGHWPVRERKNIRRAVGVVDDRAHVHDASATRSRRPITSPPTGPVP